MPPLYSGSADEWSYISNDTTSSDVKTVDFIIDNFDDEMKKGYHSLIAHPFIVKNTLWHVRVSVMLIDKQDGKNYIGFFLKNENDVNLKVDFKLTVGHVVANFVNQEVKSKNGLGWPKLLTPEICKQVLVDKRLILKIEMKLLSEEKTVICGGKSHQSSLMPVTTVDSTIFAMMSFSDFKVICNGKVFPCHKAFLAARSSVFKNMLEADMKEAKDGLVEILNHTDDVVESFVKFFYTNHIDDDVLNKHAMSFFDLGEHYQMEGLKKMAEQSLIANLSKENMLSYFTAGDMYHGEDIKEAARVFIRKNRRSLVEQEGWRDTVTNKDLLLDLIESLAKD